MYDEHGDMLWWVPVAAFAVIYVIGFSIKRNHRR
jgi:hypothetical protein